MMESPLFSLEGVIATWQNTSPPWVIETIFIIVCGVVLFLVLLPRLERDPSSRPPRAHGNIRMCPVEPKRTSSCRKKDGVMKACRGCLQDLDEVRGLITLLQSHLGRPPDLGGFHQLCCQDPPGEVYDTAPEGAHQCHREPVGDAAPATSPSASPGPRTPCPLPLASTPSAESQNQADPKTVPPGALVDCSPLGNSFLASPIPAISDLDHSRYSISTLSWWQATARTLYFSASSQHESQQEPAGHLPPAASFRGDPTDRRADTGSLSCVHPGVKRLLEVLLTRRAALTTWKEKGKEGSSLEPTNPESPLDSFGNLWKSLGAEQDPTSPQPFWSFRDKEEQVPGPQQASCLRFLEDQLQQCSQLFWGLPSLHSESLVATAWVTSSSSYLQPLSVLFNGLSNGFAGPMQPSTPAGLPQGPAVPVPGAQPHPGTANLPQAQRPPLADIQTQTRVLTSLPARLPSCPHQMRTRGGPCPASQNQGASFIPPGVQPVAWSLLQKQENRERTLPSVTQRPQDPFPPPSPNPAQESGASQGPVSVFQRDFISPSLQKRHLPMRFIRDTQPAGVHFKVQVSLDLMPGQGQLPGVCQAPDKQGPWHLSASARKSSQGSRGMGTGPRRGSQRKGRGRRCFRRRAQRCLRRIPKRLSRGSPTFALKVLGINPKNKLQRHLKPCRSDLGTGLLRRPTSHPVKLQQAHVGRKSGQMDQGSVPVSEGRCRLAHNPAPPGTRPDTDTRAPAAGKGPEHCVNTACDLPFLGPHTRQQLEGHLEELQARPRGGLGVQAPEPKPLPPLGSQWSPLPQPPAPRAAVCTSEVCSKATLAKGQGRPPQVCSEEPVLTRVSPVPPAGGLPTPSPLVEGLQQDAGETPAAPGPGRPGAPVTRGEGRPPPQPPTLSPAGKAPQPGTVRGVETPRSAGARTQPREDRGVQTSGAPCRGAAALEPDRGSHSSRATEPGAAVEGEDDPAWEVIVGPSVLADPRTLRTAGRPGLSLSSPPAQSGARDPGAPGLTAQGPRKLQLQGEGGAENRPQGRATGLRLQGRHQDILLQDFATGMLLQDCAPHVFLRDPHTDVPLAVDLLACHGAPSSSQRGLSAAQVPCDLVRSGQSRQGRQAPRLSGVKDPRKNQNKMFVPTDDRRPRPGNHKEGLAGPRTSPATGMRHPPQLGAPGDACGRRCLQPPPETGQVLPESHFRVRRPAPGPGPQDPLPGGQPARAVACSQEPVLSGWARAGGLVEAQAIMTAVGHILAQKLALHRGLPAKEFIQPGRQLQAPEGGRAPYREGLSAPKQRAVTKDASYSPHATPRGHAVSDRSSRWDFPPREPGAPGRPCGQGQQGVDSRAEGSSGGRWERTYRG